MILLYINNIEFLKKIISYLDNTNIKYTTNLNSEYEYVFIAEINNKIIDFAKDCYAKGKKIIFCSFIEEESILYYDNRRSKKSREYLKKLDTILSISTKVLVHFESTRKMIINRCDTSVVIIPKEIPIINISRNSKEIYDKYKVKKRKKKIIVVDENYSNIDKMYVLSNTYTKYNFVYIGYKPDYLLNNKEIILINSMSKNVIKVKYFDLNVFSDLCKISDIVVFLNDYRINIDYIYITLLFKKQLLIKENKLFEDFFINSKNTYTFKTRNELILKLKKVTTNRIANLSDNGYLLIKNNTFSEIIKLYNAYLI